MSSTTRRAMRRLPWAIFAVYVALAAGAVALVVFQGASDDSFGALAFGGFAGVGTLIALRRPDNAVGWLLLGTAIFFAAGEAGESYAAEPSNPGRVWVAWLSSFTTNVWFSLVLIFLPLTPLTGIEPGEVDTQVVCVDKRRQWSRWRNVWHSSAIRSTLSMLGAPVRGVRRLFA